MMRTAMMAAVTTRCWYILYTRRAGVELDPPIVGREGGGPAEAGGRTS